MGSACASLPGGRFVHFHRGSKPSTANILYFCHINPKIKQSAKDVVRYLWSEPHPTTVERDQDLHVTGEEWNL